MFLKSRHHARPKKFITSEDKELLSFIVRNMGERLLPDVAELLGEELSRAAVVNSAEISTEVARVDSLVEYRDEMTGALSTAALVYPWWLGQPHRCLSVLSVHGALLLGLTAGQCMEWMGTSGRLRAVSLLSVNPIWRMRRAA